MIDVHPELVLVGHGNAVTSLAFSADGKTLVSGSYDHTAIIWDVETGRMRRILKLRGWGNDAAVTPDGTTVVTADGQVWDARTGQPLRWSPRYIAPLACSPDGRTLASATFLRHSDRASVLLTDLHTGRTQHCFECCEHQPHSLAFSIDGLLVAASGYESREGEENPYVTTVYNLKMQETRQVLHGQNVFLFGADLAPHVRLAAVSRDGRQLWNAETGEFLKTVAVLDKASILHCECVSLSPMGQWLGVGTDQGEVTIWDVAAAKRLWQTAAHQGWLRTMAFTQDDTVLATGGDDHTIRLWDAATGTPRGTLGRPRRSVEAVAFSTEGQTITAIHENGTARLWRISPPCRQRQEADTPGVLALSAPHTPDTARNLWKVKTTTLPTNAELPQGFSIAALSADGSLMALHLPTGSLSIWNGVTRQLQHALQPASMWWGAPAFSPDNRFLAIGSADGLKVLVVDTDTAEVFQEFALDNESVAFAFSWDGGLLAVGHLGFAVTLWDVQKGRRRRRMRIARDSVSALAFSPDHKVLAVGTSYDETVWLKSLTRSRKDVRLCGHTDSIRSVDFSPEGTRIATGAQDGTVRLWEPESGKLLATFVALPEEEWVVSTPQGDYTGSSGAEKYLHF